MTSRLQRGKLLVDLATGNVNIEEKEGTSDQFFSNSFDPTKSKLVKRKFPEDEFQSQPSPSNSNLETGKLVPQLYSCSNDLNAIDSSLLNTRIDSLISDVEADHFESSTLTTKTALVDLATGNINFEEEEGTSYQFHSSSFDPTENKTKNFPEDDFQSQPSPLNSNLETGKLVPQLYSCSNDLKAIDSSLLNIRTESLISDVEADHFESSALTTETANDHGINCVLDEETGLFVPKGDEHNIEKQISGVSSSKSSNLILDHQTGELIDIENNDSDDEIIKMKIKDRHFNKTRRVKGMKYTGRKKEREQTEKFKVNFVLKQKKIKREKPCNHESIIQKTDRSFLCAAISEEQRESIFKFFWDLESWSAKKAYLKNLVRVRPVQRRRRTSSPGSSQKQIAFDCFLPNEQNNMIKVCKKFLLSTVDMNNETLTEWIKALNEDLVRELKKDELNETTKTLDTKTTQTKTSKSDSVREWLSLLTKVPSHYCRSSSKRVYVDDCFRSKTHMHKVYKKWCSKNRKVSVERKLFTTVLKNEKISIFKPRKDQCDTCTAYKEGNLTEEENQIHLQMKDEAYSAKEEARAMCSLEVLVITMDVQSVLLCPKLKVSVQYYKQKLQIHNYTIYSNNDKEVHLYVWHEGDGGVSANEFTTCLIDYLNKKISEGYKKVIVISDGCSYQNRNRILASALLNLSKFNVYVEQRILEKGHTMMEVDSVHSTLEGHFQAPIYSPNDFVNRMRQARPNRPYKIHHLDYLFFKKYESTCMLESIRPGKKAGDPVVTNIRALLYRNGEIYYKLRHPDDWQILPQRLHNNTTALSNLYSGPRKIEKSKYDSLQTLKKFMHRDYHAFYDNLLHD